jgi:hypothetical protein
MGKPWRWCFLCGLCWVYIGRPAREVNVCDSEPAGQSVLATAGGQTWPEVSQWPGIVAMESCSGELSWNNVLAAQQSAASNDVNRGVHCWDLLPGNHW